MEWLLLLGSIIAALVVAYLIFRIFYAICPCRTGYPCPNCHYWNNHDIHCHRCRPNGYVRRSGH
jgi:hypothetical protein